MMKKICIPLVTFALLITPIMAFAKQYSAKVRGSVFFPVSHRFKDIYGKIGGDAELELATKCTRKLEGWLNFTYFAKHGHSIGLCNPTTINIVNGSLGLNLVFKPISRTRLYIGAGPSLGFLRLRNEPITGTRIVCKNLVGGIFKSGIYRFIRKDLFLDFFADYLYQPTRFPSHAQVGGLKLGVGIGFAF